MNLQIRDPRAHALARRLAEKRNVSMTEAVITALEAQLEDVEPRRSLAERLDGLAATLVAKATPGGRDLGKDEIDALWGHR